MTKNVAELRMNIISLFFGLMVLCINATLSFTSSSLFLPRLTRRRLTLICTANKVNERSRTLLLDYVNISSVGELHIIPT